MIRDGFLGWKHRKTKDRFYQLDEIWGLIKVEMEHPALFFF